MDYIYFSEIPWSEVKDHINTLGKYIVQTPSDGHCFLHAIWQSLVIQHQQYGISLEDIKNTIMSEIMDNQDQYLNGLTKKQRDTILCQALEYLQKKFTQLTLLTYASLQLQMHFK